ncbi:MAG TPA: PQQ-dependent sugar dehydrogenase [Saprospiraceae bacterium]|nr:PQQ-dependent sugar dehydrogenase [Saprospiraceae bacterium]HMQ83853.1 PQQ-dependent sugar dehydrogenase [Saprospiraceae bacterium]
MKFSLARRSYSSLNTWLPFGFMLLLLFCSPPKKNNNRQATNQSSDIAALYANNCGGCHGNQLQRFKSLKSYQQPEEYLVKMISQGNLDKGMPAFGEALSEAQIQQLSQYIRTFDYNKSHDAKPHNDSTYTYEVVVGDLEIPWGMEFLPNGDLLIAEKKGVLSRFSKAKGKQEISGVPAVRADGQGGLLDIKLHPDYAENGWIYIAYSYIDEANRGRSNTAIIRAKLSAENKLQEIQPIYRGVPTVSAAHHYGTRMVFDSAGYLYFGIGDRGQRDEFPQTLNSSNGKIHRLKDDGSIPEDNPFVGQANSVTSIYSYGHRNPQGLAIHPLTGEIWEHEHGPKGGDEINIVQKGLNYGWPVISYGINYSGTKFTDITEKEGMEQPIHYYVPSIAPCGMAFLDSDVYPQWKYDLFIGSLSFSYLERLVLNGNQVVYQEKLLEELNSRVRNVKVGPDGYLYVAVENPGRILRLLPR